MKKLLVLLLIPLVSFSSFGQGDFRKMNWGESEADLKRGYYK